MKVTQFLREFIQVLQICLKVNYVPQIYSIWRAFTTESNYMNQRLIKMGSKNYGTVMHHFRNLNMGGLRNVLRW